MYTKYTVAHETDVSFRFNEISYHEYVKNFFLYGLCCTRRSTMPSMLWRFKKIHYAQHVENKRRLHSTSWGNTVLICKLDIPFLEHSSCNRQNCVRWNHLLFCGLQQPQRGFCNLWLQWGCALGRTSQRPQHWVVDSCSPRRQGARYKVGQCCI